MNVKFHKNCKNTGKILKISCARCNFVKFDIHFHFLNFLVDSRVKALVFVTCNDAEMPLQIQTV